MADVVPIRARRKPTAREMAEIMRGLLVMMDANKRRNIEIGRDTVEQLAEMLERP